MEKRYGTPVAGHEKEVLTGFLDHYRRTLLEVCEGLPEEQLRRPMVPSGTSLLGMVKHLALAERWWFQENRGRDGFPFPVDESDPEAEFRFEENETSEEIFQLYRDACAHSRLVSEAWSLEELVENPGRSGNYNVRWALVHMIEETARHTGHADIIRELIDGKTGAGYTD